MRVGSNPSYPDTPYPGMSTHSVTPREVFNALDISLQWLESQGTDPTQLLLEKKWHEI